MRTLLIATMMMAAAPAFADDAKPETRHCVNSLNARTRMTDRHELIVGGAWRNLAGGCAGILKGNAFHIQTGIPQYCEGDILTVFKSSGVGSECTLGVWENIPKAERER